MQVCIIHTPIALSDSTSSFRCHGALAGYFLDFQINPFVLYRRIILFLYAS